MNTATLHDGRVVSTTSEEWRAECEARTVLSWPLRRRRAFMYGTLNQFGKPDGGVLQRRGEAALKQLEQNMRAIWEQRQQAANDNMAEMPKMM